MALPHVARNVTQNTRPSSTFREGLGTRLPHGSRDWCHTSALWVCIATRLVSPVRCVDLVLRFAYVEHDVLVLRKQFKDSPIHSFMGRGVIDLPVEQVAQFVGNLQTRKLWDRTLVVRGRWPTVVRGGHCMNGRSLHEWAVRSQYEREVTA